MLIVQITDTHITCDGEQARYLSDAIAWVNALQPRPAAVVLSGDTAHAGRREQYALLGGILAGCAVPVYVVPGNHDRREALRDVLPAVHFPGAGERLNYVVDLGLIRLVGLDTAERGRPGGFLDAAGLAWFAAALRAQPDRPVLVFMHHPPFRTGVNAADWLGFKGRREFAAIIVQHPMVQRIIAGHIHCEPASVDRAGVCDHEHQQRPATGPRSLRAAAARATPGTGGLRRSRLERRPLHVHHVRPCRQWPLRRTRVGVNG